jgi:UDP-glucose 4-epimerase
MDKAYLQELISEANARGGGLVINQNDQPAVVVMTVDKYNQMLGDKVMPQTQTEAFHSHNNKTILVTGGAGYIGSHTCRELLKAGYGVVVLDNLSTGKKQNIPEGAEFIEGDTADKNLLLKIFADKHIYAVLHFAASIEVEESVRQPQKYLQNNALNTANVLAAMAESKVKNFIFSSTAAVYGDQDIQPIPETARAKPNNPYGYAKFVAEKIIKYHAQFMGLKAVIFRYFNACGCDFDGAIVPTHHSHLIPIVMQAAAGDMPALKVYGKDYGTPDGTCVRDYVHVLDIARAHVVALDKIAGMETFEVYNIGTGSGQSVLDVVNAAKELLKKDIPLEFLARRPGDAVITVADNRKIREAWGFKPEFSDLETIIKTTWRQMYHS